MAALVVAWILAMVESGAVVVRVAEVLRDGMLGTRVGNCPTMVAFTVIVVVVSTGVGSRLELLLNSAVLVLAIVVKVMTVAASSGFVVSLVTSAALRATSIDGIAVDLAVVGVLGLLYKTGKLSWAMVAAVVMAMSVSMMSVTVTVSVAVAMTVDMVAVLVVSMRIGEVVLNCACSSSEASKSEGLEHDKLSFKKIEECGI